jgi:short-subunit dehydrogenase
MRLDGARVWIVGASSGIGAALARELERRGSRVAISARRRESLQEVAGRSMLVVPLDVTRRDAVADAAAEVRATLGGLDLAVMSAGSWQQMDVARWDGEAFDRQIDTNLRGLANVVAAVAPEMRRARSGTICGIASVAGYRGMPRSEAYGATKAGAINLLESVRIDLRPYGVRVVTVCPGFVRTALTEGNDFPMPFMIDAETSARRIADGLEKGKAEIVFPLPMMLLMKTARLVPVRLWAAAWGRTQR